MKTKNTFSVITAVTVISLFLSTQTRAQVVLYGLTSAGGINDVGIVFSVTPSGRLTTIANLDTVFAANPYGSLLYASDGNFYASSVNGGATDSCTIFRCSSTGVLKTMICLDTVWGYSWPQGNSLIQAWDGNLYGMTTNGGPDSAGVLFKLQLSGYYSAIHFFNDTDAGYPFGSLIQTSDSEFWGMTCVGGVNYAGAIFHCTYSGVFTSVFSFDTLDGINPFGDLFQANDGSFYGLALKGGKYRYFGTLFRYNPSGIFTKLVDFDDTNGALPYGSLIQATNSNLYGLTSRGGVFGFGTLFVSTLSGNLTTLVSFNDSNGANPYGTLIQASDGYLYGMTYSGGKYNDGTIFQCSLSGNLTKLVDFNGTNGAYPEYGKLIEIDKLLGIPNVLTNQKKLEVFPNPNNGIFTIALGHAVPLVAGSASQISIDIYNVLGERVFTSTLPSPNGGGESVYYQINLSSQPNGVYFYRVVAGDGGLAGSGKIVIEK